MLDLAGELELKLKARPRQQPWPLCAAAVNERQGSGNTAHRAGGPTHLWAGPTCSLRFPYLVAHCRWSLYWYLDVCDDHRFPNSLAVKAIKNFLLIPSFYSWSTYGARCDKLLKRDISYHIPRILSSLTNDSPFCCDAMLPMEHWAKLCQNQNKSLISPMRWF